MPVWHALTRPWREDGSLRLVGIVQEQHPERARLFAQWKQLGWPILWDPFQTTGSTRVPYVVLVDADGIVRAVDPEPETFAARFLALAGEPSAGEASAPLEASSRGQRPADEEEHALERARGGLLHGTGELSPLVETLVLHALRHPGDARAQYQAGVALLMRHDSSERRGGDFQAAVDAWTHALALDPGQYVWRRRLQQYGPRMDKPYDFYGWVETARTEIERRGETPVPLSAELTPAERAQPRHGFAEPVRAEPDPEGRVERDREGWIAVDTAVVFSTEGARRTASVHLELAPVAGVRWDLEAGPLEVWLGQRDRPAGWTLSERRFTRVPAAPDALERFALEIDLDPRAPSEGQVEGYVLFHACEARRGACATRRRDFSLAILPPAPDAK